ncbi:MAG: capsid cement protein [Candidatus Margulisiibacteriota bacterium]
MSQTTKDTKTFIAGTNLEAYRRVKLSANSGTQVEYAIAGEAFIGVTAAQANSGEHVAVDLKTTGRTFKLMAAGAINPGANIYGAVDGQISAAVSGPIIGKALEPATAALEVIEVLFI